MKSASTAMQGHLASPLTTICTAWSITRRDGKQFFFTDHDQDIFYNNQFYRAALSYSRSAVEGKSDMSPDTMDAEGVIDSSEISDADLRRGLFDGAAVAIFALNYADLTMGQVNLRRGTIGEVSHGLTRYTAVLLGMAQKLGYNTRLQYSPLCRATFGDFHCQVDVPNLYTYEGTVASVIDQRTFTTSGLSGAGPVSTVYQSSLIKFTPYNIIQDGNSGFGVFTAGDVVEITGSEDNDGTKVFFIVHPNTVAVEDQTINLEYPGPLVTFTKTVPGYYEQGVLTWLTGANAGVSMEVKAWTGAPSDQMTLELAMPYPIAVGDTFKVTAGCDKTWRACISFNNALNFRGEPFVPGQDAVLDYPNAQ